MTWGRWLIRSSPPRWVSPTLRISRRGVPDHEAAAARLCGRNQAPAVGSELKQFGVSVELLDLEQFFAEGDVPELDRAVLIGAGQHPTVRRERQRDHVTAVAQQVGTELEGPCACGSGSN